MQKDGIAYDIQGEGEWLLMINGIGAPKESWALQLEDLPRRFRCLTFDNPGLGGSEPLADGFSTGDMADTAARLLAALDIEKAHVMGVSMGGAIAQELAIRHPALVDRLAVVCSWTECDRYLARCFEIMRDIAATEQAKGAPGWSIAVQKFISLIAFAEADFAEAYESIEAIETGVADAAAGGDEPPAKTFIDQAAACLAHNTRDRLGSVASPTLILAGDEDRFTPLPLSRELAGLIPQARMDVMEGCGHVMFYERPADFNHRIAAFLSEET